SRHSCHPVNAGARARRERVYRTNTLLTQRDDQCNPSKKYDGRCLICNDHNISCLKCSSTAPTLSWMPDAIECFRLRSLGDRSGHPVDRPNCDCSTSHTDLYRYGMVSAGSKHLWCNCRCCNKPTSLSKRGRWSFSGSSFGLSAYLHGHQIGLRAEATAGNRGKKRGKERIPGTRQFGRERGLSSAVRGKVRPSLSARLCLSSVRSSRRYSLQRIWTGH